MRKLIVTAALTGGQHTKEANPNLPEQPAEIAASAQRCYNEGASIAHIHARDPEGKPSGDAVIYRDIHSRIRSRCNMIIQDSTGGGPNLDYSQKVACLEAEPDMASLNMGTMLRTLGPLSGTPFINARADIESCAKQMLAQNIKPEMEVYHHGMLREVDNLIQKGLVKKPYYINFVLNMAYQGAVAGIADNLMTLKMLLPADSLFNVTAVGASQLPMTTLSMLIGGMVRVGLEDNIYISKGVLAAGNEQLVARTVRMARELGLDIASPEEARQILGLPGASQNDAERETV
jgi:3-keto-5-aminohexanoate cleavage enzyme